jgi:predicted transcriptional regulator
MGKTHGDVDSLEARQLADIEAGLREAKRGDFASDAEVAATIAKHTKRTRLPRTNRSSKRSSS